MNDAQRRRACILEVADRLLRHYGPQKTTIADVAREAGVGVGSVYLEFPSKDVLVEEIARARYRRVLDAMVAVACVDEQAASERLVALLDARLDALLAIAAEGVHACDLLHCSGGMTGVSAALKHAQASYHEEELGLVADLLRLGAEAGELDVEDPKGVARTVLRAYVTFSAPGPGGLAGRSGDELKSAMAAMHQLVLRGLLRRAPVTTGSPAGASVTTGSPAGASVTTGSPAGASVTTGSPAGAHHPPGPSPASRGPHPPAPSPAPRERGRKKGAGG